MIFGDRGRESLGLCHSLRQMARNSSLCHNWVASLSLPQCREFGGELIDYGCRNVRVKRSSSAEFIWWRIVQADIASPSQILQCRSGASIWDYKMNFYKKRAKFPTPVSILNALSDFSLAPPRRISLLSFWQTCRSGRGRDALPPPRPRTASLLR